MRLGLLTSILSLSMACGPPAKPDPELFALPEPALEELDVATRSRLEDERDEVIGLLEARDPARGEALWQLGRLYLAHDFDEAAVVVLRGAAELAGEDPDRFYLLGVAQQRKLDLEEAELSLERSLDLRPGDLAVLHRLARVELDLGRLERSRQVYLEALRRDPSSALAHFGLGSIAGLENQPEKAIEHLTETLRLQPSATAAHHALAMALRDLGRIDEAKDHLEQAGSIRPTAADSRIAALSELLAGSQVHVAQGDRALLAGRLDRAIALYRKAVELDPENARALHDLGAALGRSGEHSKALAYLHEAVGLDPLNRDARFDLAMSLAHTGDLRACAEQLEAVLELDSSDREAARRLAAVLVRSGRMDDAEDHLARLIASDPEDLVSGRQLAELHSLRGHLELAVEEYRALLTLDPTSVHLHLGLARAWIAGGEPLLARSLLEEGLEELENPIALRPALARLLISSPDPAARDGERGLELAREIFASEPSLENGEWIILALTITGRIEEAIEWRRSLLDQAENAPAPSEVQERLREALAELLEARGS